MPRIANFPQDDQRADTFGGAIPEYTESSIIDQNFVGNGYVPMPNDGWISQVGARIWRRTDGAEVSPRVYVDDVLSATGPFTSIAAVYQLLYANFSVRARKGQSITYGFQRRAGHISVSLDRIGNSGTGYYHSASGPAQDRFSNYGNIRRISVYALGGYIDYVAQQPPSKGSITQKPPANITEKQITIEVSHPHGNGDGAHDLTNALQVRVYKQGNSNQTIYNQTYGVSESTARGGNITVQDIKLPDMVFGTTYEVDVRHRDTWGEWAPFTEPASFQLRNYNPSKGAFTGPSDGTVSNSTSVTFRMDTPHDNGDGAYDYTDKVQLRVYDAQTNQQVYNETLATNQAQKNNKVFAVTVDGLNSGKAYYADFRHQDSAGSWSAFSDRVSFAIAAVPDSPELLTPSVKLDVRSGFDYRMVHNHPEGRPAKAVEMELYNAAGTTRLWASGTRTLPSQVAAGAILGTGATGGSPAHPTLAWGTGYSWRARVQDTLNAWSNWTPRMSFRTNSTPTAPTGLVPANNARTGNRNFSAAVSDPDGDLVTAAQMELVRVSNGQMVSGYPRAMQINEAGNRATYTVPESDLAAGQQYRWRVRANDGIASGWGPWSPYSQFSYAIAPVVSLLTPSQLGRLNMVARPSAEYDTSENEWWEIVGASEANYIIREQTDDTAFGNWRWRGVVTDLEEDFPYMQSPMLPVDSTERYLYQMMAKRILSEDPDAPDDNNLVSSMYIVCYDSSQQFISSIGTYSIKQLYGDAPNPYWTTYGGAVWPAGQTSGWPANTAFVKLVCLPVTNGIGEVAFDGVMFEVMPKSQAGPGGAGKHFSDSSFFGYADPDIDTYGGPNQYSGEWVDEPGNSESDVVAVLWEPAENFVMYSYSHPNSVPLYATRVIVQRYVAGEGWRPHHNSGYMQPASTPTVSLPDYLFRNEGRYRVKVICRDNGQIDGESEWVEFATRFTGPPEIPVFSYEADSERGTITVSFASTGLDEAEFGGIEVARSADDETMKIVDVIRNAGASQYTYHFPVSAKNYRFYVRQVRLVGPERIEGRWRTIDASVDYSGFNFVKNAHAPDEMLIFQHTSGAGPAQAREAQGEAYTPWGSVAPVHLFSEARARSDSTSFILFPHYTQSVAARLETLKRWDVERPPLCLLVQQPEPEKIFVALTGTVSLSQERDLRRAEITWQETSFAEPTPYELEGALDEFRSQDLGQPL